MIILNRTECKSYLESEGYTLTLRTRSQCAIFSKKFYIALANFAKVSKLCIVPQSEQPRHGNAANSDFVDALSGRNIASSPTHELENYASELLNEKMYEMIRSDELSIS